MVVITPPGQSPPFAIITDTDHSGWVIIATAFGLSCVLICGLIRVFVRIAISPPFGHDDTVLAAATVFACIQSSIIFYAISKGFGKAPELITPENRLDEDKADYASILFFLATLYLSKCSVSFLLLRLTSDKTHTKVFKATIAVATLWVIASIFAIALRCDLAHPWVIHNEKCPNLYLRWSMVSVFDILTEIMLFGMSIYLVYNLQMSVSNKVVVVTAFGLRLPVIVAIALRLHYLKAATATAESTIATVLFIIWTQVELDFSIMASTIPCLKPFVAGLNTNYGSFDPGKTNGYGSDNQNSRGSNFNMTPLDSATRRSVAAPKSKRLSLSKVSNFSRPKPGVPKFEEKEMPSVGGIDGQIMGGDHHGTTTVNGGRMDANSIGSNDSRQMIIRKDVEWTVEHGSSGGELHQMGDRDSVAAEYHV